MSYACLVMFECPSAYMACISCLALLPHCLFISCLCPAWNILYQLKYPYLLQKNILALPCLVSSAYTLSCLSYELMTCLVVRISCIRKTRMPCMKILYEKNTMACLGISCIKLRMSCMACLIISSECLLWPV